MVEKKDQRTESFSVYEFQSLSPENGFFFITERDRAILEKTLSPEDIFKIHEAKFLIWEKFGMVNVFIGKAFNDDDTVTIVHNLPQHKYKENLKYHFDIPGCLYLTFDKFETFREWWIRCQQY